MTDYMRDYQSFSSLSTYMRCGIQYAMRYVEGIKTPPAVALITGSAGHKGVEVNMVQKIDTRVDLPLDEVLDATAGEFDVRAEEVEDWEGVKPGAEKDNIIGLMKVVHTKHFPKVQPAQVEQEYILDIQGQKMKAYIDLIDDRDVVRDNKFVKRAKSQGDTDKDMQLSLYSYATRKTDVAFDCMIKGKNDVKTVTSKRDIRDWERIETIIPALVKGIKAGIFLPAEPTHWCCSEKFCGYWNLCPQGGKRTNAVRVDMGANETINEMDIL